MSNITRLDAKQEGSDVVFYIWGKRIVMAHNPHNRELTQELVQKIADLWHADYIVPANIVEKLYIDTIGKH